MSNSNKMIRSVVGAAVVALVVLSLFMPAPSTMAAPAAAPTPAASGFASRAPTELTWSSAVATTADGGSAALQVAGYTVADIQYVIDQGTVNTTTLKIQFSNDNVNWTDGATLVTDNAADASVLSQVAMFGKWARIYKDVTNTNPVTVTVIGILK